LSLKGRWSIGRVAVLAALLVAVVAVSGCVRGITPVGWSGGTASDDTLYVGSREGRLVALNLTDDSRQWSEPLKAAAQTGLFGCSPAGGCGGGSTGVPIYGNPVVSGNLVYIAGYNGQVKAYNSDTLAVRWVYPREGYLKPIVGGLVSDGDKLYIGDSGGIIYALDAATGDPLWQASFAAGDEIWSTPAVSGGVLYVGSFDKKLYALNTADGSKKWEFHTEGSIMATPLVDNGVVYFGSLDRNFYAVNAADGSLRWKITAENWFWSEPVIVNDTIYAGCLDGKVYALRAANGATVIIDLKQQISSRPVVIGSSIIFVTRKGVVYSIDTASNQARQLADLKLEVDGPLTAYQDIIYIHTQDISLHRVNADTGAVLPSISLKAQG
jgi:outer membrane protein assembly factor BamB